MVVDFAKTKVLGNCPRNRPRVARVKHIYRRLALRRSCLGRSCPRARIRGLIDNTSNCEQIGRGYRGNGRKIPACRFVVEEIEQLVLDNSTAEADPSLMSYILGIKRHNLTCH